MITLFIRLSTMCFPLHYLPMSLGILAVGGLHIEWPTLSFSISTLIESHRTNSSHSDILSTL